MVQIVTLKGFNLTVQTHPADIIALVSKAGSSLSALARAYRMSPSSFAHSLRRPIPEANRAIARFLGVPPVALWPDWFDEDGNRRELRRNATSHKPSRRKSQNSGSYADRRSAA
jgi:lambda repressor-like predicted transcriptional regulator